MIKELKYIFYLIVISLFVFFSLKYYFSDHNKKINYRSTNDLDTRINLFSKDLIFLKSDTENIIEYSELINDKKKMNFHFWNLLK